MTQSYAMTLIELGVKGTEVDQAAQMLRDCPELLDTLDNPTIANEEKYAAIERIFPNSMHGVLKLLSEDNEVHQFEAIRTAYHSLNKANENCAYARVEYVTPLTEPQIASMKKMVMEKTGKGDVQFEMVQNPDLVGGFVLQVGDLRYDRSARHNLQVLRESLRSRTANHQQVLKPDEIISVLKTEIEDFDRRTAAQETGTVVRVGDGIATVYGMEEAMYGELVEFETGVRGIVQNLETGTTGVVLLGSDYGITEGTTVMRTKKRAGVGVSEAMIGRVVDALGSPIDGGTPFTPEAYYAVEREAAGVAARKSVSTPLQTGILSIDAMFPIGRGQRELIIGDRQTGKTSIAVDTIINQKGQNMICIYVAIGQKSSTVAKIVSNLKKHDAMAYTIVVSASASEPAPIQYIAPYSGTAIAEYFMEQGKDVLIIYDDLSKHAVAYRAMSLLLHRPPGREAYPGDVFYLHSRLLERSCRLDDAHGGGSITALPIIETQAGDLSAYIPTNVISITDGQLFLESELFNSGFRPAVNVGLSVSRVGGAAQTKAMKKVAGRMRIDLAQYRELEVFTQFSSDLDPETRQTLNHGKVLMELLKQPLYAPLPVWKEVVILAAGCNGYLDEVELDRLRDYREELAQYVDEQEPQITAKIRTDGTLSDEDYAQLLACIEHFKEQVG